MECFGFKGFGSWFAIGIIKLKKWACLFGLGWGVFGT
jgi:hypothetical protein